MSFLSFLLHEHRHSSFMDADLMEERIRNASLTIADVARRIRDLYSKTEGKAVYSGPECSRVDDTIILTMDQAFEQLGTDDGDVIRFVCQTCDLKCRIGRSFLCGAPYVIIEL